jgi:hypothetical protein
LAHNSTVFAQLLKLIPRHEFETLAKEHHQGQKLRKMSRWSQFVALSLGQLAGRASLARYRFESVSPSEKTLPSGQRESEPYLTGSGQRSSAVHSL